MCRRERLLSWRNERSLFRRKCDATGKDIVSVFSPESSITVYERDYWWSDKWDPMDYGKEYDFSRPFFEQYGELIRSIPMPSTFNTNCVNCNYCNHLGKSKNCYLVFASWQNEDLIYSAQCGDVRDSSDVLTGNNCELCYEIVKGIKLYNSMFVESSENCSESAFLYECKGCQYCFGCTNLRNKSYYFFNEPCTKEEYFEKLKEFDLGTRDGIERARDRFEKLKMESIRRPSFLINSSNSTGDYLEHCESCKYCFGIRNGGRNCKYCINGGYVLNDSYDTFGCGANAELLYQAIDTGFEGSRFLFDIVVYGGVSVEYSYNCHGSSNLFGCVGLRSKQYCILNKEYSKEEYEELLPKIKQHMMDMPYRDNKGRVYTYGEFFPVELSPFAYNESLAYEHFPYSESEMKEKGYSHRELPKNEYAVTLKAGEAPKDIKEVKDDILDQVIECAHGRKCLDNCVGAFKITPRELALYRRMNVALPVLCPNCRHMERVRRTNPFFLWHGKCQCRQPKTEYQNTTEHFHGDKPCPNEFETSYAPERKEIVYCEACYQSEVV